MVSCFLKMVLVGLLENIHLAVVECDILEGELDVKGPLLGLLGHWNVL
jgi:hypothetical protein